MGQLFIYTMQKYKKIKKITEINKSIKKILSKENIKEINKLKNIRRSYYKKCKKFISVVENNDLDYVKIYKKIKNDNDLKWGFLGGSNKFKIKRSLMEAKKFIKNYELKLVN